MSQRQKYFVTDAEIFCHRGRQKYFVTEAEIFCHRGRIMRQNLAELDFKAQFRLNYEAELRLQNERKWNRIMRDIIDFKVPRQKRTFQIKRKQKSVEAIAGWVCNAGKQKDRNCQIVKSDLNHD